MIYVVTGHLGSGKTLLSVRLAQMYMQAGKRVASNLTLRCEHMVKATDRGVVVKLPYIPTAKHLEALGKGYDGPYDEEKFGLIILDEAGTWLNSHDWKDKERRGLFHWITHARKYGWDVALIVQDFEALDAQIRRSVTELHVKCSRLDRIKLPYLPLKLPRVHAATARYQGPTGAIYKRWFTEGTDLFSAFDTREAIKAETMLTDDGEEVDMRATVSLLSAWHLKGRYVVDGPSVWVRLLWWMQLGFILALASVVSVIAGHRPSVATKPILGRFTAQRAARISASSAQPFS
jgi:hypothetical protein